MVFKTLDPFIINVSKSQDANNAYVVEHESVGKIMIRKVLFYYLTLMANLRLRIKQVYNQVWF